MRIIIFLAVIAVTVYLTVGRWLCEAAKRRRGW